MTFPADGQSASRSVHAAPRRSRRRLWWILGSVGVVLLVCCVGGLVVGLLNPPPPKPPTQRVAAASASATSGAAARTASAPAASPSPTAAKPTTQSTSADPDHRICKVTDGGTYYLNITSALAHNFAACAGGEPFPGTLDDLFGLPHNMDRRCTLGNDYTAREQAIVGVYSDTVSANLEAARVFCRANGGELR